MRPMSSKFIPEHIDPFRHAEQSLQLDGAVKVSEMQRLSSSLNGRDELVDVHLEFGKDEQGITFIKGDLKTKLNLQCQRCMGPFEYEIISSFLLGVVNTLEEANALPEHYEPALAKDGQLALRELIEDELILNMPIIPRHEPEDCQVSLPADAGWEQGKEKNPFQVLESLKHKQRKEGGE